MTDSERLKYIHEMTELLIHRIRINHERFPTAIPLGVILCIQQPVDGLAFLLPLDTPEQVYAMETAVKEIAKRDAPDSIKEFSPRDN